ncbi:MAG: hypothetical protein ACPG7F_06115 [Aggregatilineales bacterium]
MKRFRLSTVALWVLVGILPPAAFAHVKWFSNFAFTDAPLNLQEVLSPLVLGLIALSAVSIGVFVFVDRKIEDVPLYQRIKHWLMARQNLSIMVLRIGMGITLILSWQDDSLLAPYLSITDMPVLGWIQFVLALLLIFPRSVPLAGTGIIGLWLVGVFNFGGFYMLDYLAFVGIGAFLMFGDSENPGLKGLAIPALYFGVGFSLIWLGMEKLVYPAWGLQVLETAPMLTLGLPPEFFLSSAAFVEIVLGYVLIIGLLGRPMGLTITLVFFTTTLFFGKVEVIGHTHLHAALIVFMLNGAGKAYPAPIDIHRRLDWRVAFAVVNFVIITGVFTLLYTVGAEGTYIHALTEEVAVEDLEACRSDATALIETENSHEIPCEALLQYHPDLQN